MSRLRRLTALAAGILAVSAPAAAATTSGIDIDTPLIAQDGQLRFYATNGMTTFDTTCDADFTKWFEGRLVTVTAPLTFIGYLTSAAFANCTRQVVRPVGVAATLSGGSILNLAYTGTDLTTGAMRFAVLGWQQTVTPVGSLISCTYGGTLNGEVNSAGRFLTFNATLTSSGGLLCPSPLTVTGTTYDSPQLVYTLLRIRR